MGYVFLLSITWRFFLGFCRSSQNALAESLKLKNDLKQTGSGLATTFVNVDNVSLLAIAIILGSTTI